MYKSWGTKVNEWIAALSGEGDREQAMREMRDAAFCLDAAEADGRIPQLDGARFAAGVDEIMRGEIQC
jgi:hypothetical protein